MKAFNICAIRPRGFLHTSATAEVRESLSWALAKLGYEVREYENAFSAGRARNIVFHCELLSPGAELPPNSIIYNLESKAHPNFTRVLELARQQKAVLWDYAAENVKAAVERGIEAYHVPIGYTPNLRRNWRRELPEGDVMFVGWMTPRRKALIEKLREAGLKVYASDACYGGARDYVMSRSKIALNVHHDGRTAFEIVRVSYYLANQMCVVSEASEDDREYMWLNGGVMRVHYDRIVDAVETLVGEANERHAFEIKGFQAFEKQDYSATLERVLRPQNPRKSDLYNKDTKIGLEFIRQRYARGLESGDMQDFMGLLRSLAGGKMLEIGVRDGASTSALLLGLEDRERAIEENHYGAGNGSVGFLTSVDVVDCSGLWKHRLWEFVKSDSKDLDIRDGILSLAFIDGDHSAAQFTIDLENCLRWVRPGGVILCHDIAPDARHTKEAAGGDWPSKFVGEIFWKTVRERKLRAFQYPGDWGMGIVIR